MSKHISTKQLEKYCEKALSPDELIQVDDHFFTCDACYRRLDELSRLPEKFTGLEVNDSAVVQWKSDHLPYDQMAAYVDDESDAFDREIVESHMEMCARCAGEVDSLFELKRQLKPPLVKKRMLSSDAVRGHLGTGWRRPAGWNPARLAWIATAIGAVILVLLFWRERFFDKPAPPPRTEQTTIVKDALPHDSSTQPAQSGNEKAEHVSKGAESRTAGNPRKSYPRDGSAGLPSPNAIIALKDGGGQITLDKQGNVGGLEALPSSLGQLVKVTLRAQKIKRPAVLAEISGEITLLGGPDERVPFTLAAPVGTVIMNASPTFSWHPLNGATNYSVSVFDSEFNQAAESGELPTTQWRISTPLKRGVVYSWQVTALKDGKKVRSPTPPLSIAQFKILKQSKADELERAKRLYAHSHLVLALLYAREGLVDESKQELQMLEKNNPDSPVAKRLLRSVQSWRSR